MNESALPTWAEELRLRYLAGEASMFLLHGNVRDLHAWTEPDGSVCHLSLHAFLQRFLVRTKEFVATYDLSEGLVLADRKMDTRLRAVIGARRMARGEDELGELPTTSREVLSLVEEIVTAPTMRSAVVIDYVECIVPMGDLAFMGDRDKANLVALQRWASDPALLQSDNLVILVTEQISDVHRRVVSSPQLATVSVSLPSVEERTAFIQSIDQGGVTLEMDLEALANVTAGLSLLQIQGLFRRAQQGGEAITFRTVSLRKKAIIEQECHGLVEFVDPGHDFSHVGGMERVKADLQRVARFVREGRTNRVLMGVLFVGPMGTGKTFIAEAFAAESGLTCLRFKNFREKWVGSTEGNLEKILQVVDALGYVLLIIDEADRSMSSGGDSDGGTNSRVIARLKEFMSDTSHRGRVVIMMMTNRPDKMDADLKRPGRLDLKIPFFFPETVDERAAILSALARRNKLALEEGVSMVSVAQVTEGYSSAELEAVVLAAAGRAAEGDRDLLRSEDLEAATEDVIPSRDTRMLAYMEMLAVFEASSRRLLPERFRHMDVDEVHARLDALRLALGSRIA